MYSVDSSEYVSPHNCLDVIGGSFYGYFHIGVLPEGQYRLDVSYNDVIVSRPIEIGGEFVSIDYINYSDGELQFGGSSNAMLVNAAVYGDNGYRSLFISSTPISSLFSERVYIGDLLPGAYTLKVTGTSSIAIERFVVGESEPYANDSVYSSDKTILYEYHGNVQTYILPDHVEFVAAGAFDNATIGKFILTKDVEWDSEPIDNRYPLQNAHVTQVEIVSGVTVIPNYLFACTDIDELVIPSSVRTIGVKSFYLCNNLEHVVFSDHSKIELIGSYAFSNNESLHNVEFGSSEEGYSCSMDTGCFFNTSLTVIRFNSDFNLYSIGTACFANCGQFSMLIGDENGQIMHIPGTVGNIGHSAFTDLQKTTSNVEPAKNTIYGLTGYSLTSYAERTSDYRLIFEENNNLTRIEDKCFQGRVFCSIDLSGCSVLESVGKGAFDGCLRVGNTSLILSSSIKKVEDGAFKSNGDAGKLMTKDSNGNYLYEMRYVIPANVEYIGEYSFMGISANISFEEHSQLTTLHRISYLYKGYQSFDLTNCTHLSYIDIGSRDAIILPAGVLIANMAPLLITSAESKNTTIKDNRLEIDEDTKVVCFNYNSVTDSVEWLSDSISIECNPENPYFRYDDGILYFTSDDVVKIIYVANKKSVVLGPELKDNTELNQYSFSSQLKTIYINNSKVVLGSDLFLNAVDLRNVYIGVIPETWSIPEVFSTLPQGVNIYVPSNLSESDMDYLKSKGNVYIGFVSGDKTVYLPTSWDGKSLVLSDIKLTNSSFECSVLMDGMELNKLDFISIGANITVVGGHICIDSYAPIVSNIVVKISNPLVYNDSSLTVIFDGNGGKTEQGKQLVVVNVREGIVLDRSVIPSFARDSFTANGWIDEFDQTFELSQVITRDITLRQKWDSRNPIVTVSTIAADIQINGSVNTQIEYTGGSLILQAQARAGFELSKWLIDGEERGSADNPLLLENISTDMLVSVSYRYYSQSSGLNSVNNTGMPTVDDISDIVPAYVVGGYVDTTMSVWKGTSSVPLVVGNYMYLRIAEKIYKIESDTGYIIKSVDSDSKASFYHSLGYGDGVIIDYHTSRVYDLDLNQLYVLDRAITGVEYYNGAFYTSGSNVYTFSSIDEDATTASEQKHLVKLGTISNVYSSYGFSTSCFVDHYMYRITADGKERGLAAMNLETGAVSYHNIRCMSSMYLDDGWLSYYGGYLFMTAYSEGLFGAVATTCGDRLVYIPVDGMEFGVEKYYEFRETTFTSCPVFYDGRLFVSVSGSLYVFDLPDNLSDLSIDALGQRHVSFVPGHGSFVIDVSHLNESGSPIYAYGIPYDTHQGPTMWIAEDKGGVLTSVSVYTTEREWNSQAIRSDIDGRMLWYNDSGWTYCYTTLDKNVYYFFIEDGGSAVWYRAYGDNVADALSSLGVDIVTLNSARIIQSVNGHSVTGGISLEMLKATYGTVDNNGLFNNLDQYSWVTITNLGDVSYSLNHYFRIICGNGESVTTGTEFSYVEDGKRKTYTFADNIGDRSIIGKQLSRGTEVVFLRFYDEEGNELPNTASVVKNGSSAKIHFPEVNRVGYVPVWKDSSNNGNEVSDIYGMVFTSNASFYLTWEPLPPGYLVTGAMETVSGTTAWSADVMIKSGVGSVADLQVKVTAVTFDGLVLSDDKVTTANGKASGTFETADVVLIYIRIVDEHVEGNLGYAMIEREAHP